MNIQNRQIPSIQQIQNEHLKSSKTNKNNNIQADSFGSILQKKLQEKQELRFSKHANLRLEARNIELNNDQIRRIENGIKRAEEKGIKETLMVVDNIAMVVNIENKTVLTALDQQETKSYVFTNIDGAVLL